MSTALVTEEAIRRVADAFEAHPKSAYAATCVYPMAAPAFESTPRAERERPQADKLRLYVHIPFCNYHCSFCFFATRTGANRSQMERYVAAIERELEWIEPGTSLAQMFVGGGTPTALPADLLDRVLGAVHARTTDVRASAHTVEASPETVSPDHLQVLQDRGVRRISMGIQTLHEGVLGKVRRIHDAKDSRLACESILERGFILNVDLMYGLPGQTRESFRRDLETVASWGVPSFTLYNLRLNETTTVAKALQDDEFLDLENLMRWRAEVAQAAQDLGLTQTRWHTFKRLDSIASRHEREPCFGQSMQGFQLGVGMSARSHLGAVVFRNHIKLEEYVGRIESGVSPVEQSFPLDEEGLRTQYLARSIGDGKSLEKTHYEAVFGRPIDEDYGYTLSRLGEAGLIDDDGASLRLSALGQLVYDRVTIAFYPKPVRDWLRDRPPPRLSAATL